MNFKQNSKRKQTSGEETTPLTLVLSKLPGATQGGSGYQACCPAHEDRKASLSISEGEDHRVLLNCHAGCPVEDVCEAIDISVSDLFPKASTVYAKGRKPAKRSNNVDKQPKKTDGPSFATANKALAALKNRHRKWSARYDYHDAKGKLCGVVVRWDRPKNFRPVALIDGRWHLGGMPQPRPLYRLPDVLKATTVYVCEGEKAADAVRSLGLTATTSAHGSQSADKTDWQPLAGKSIVILPDNDEAGRKYAELVAAILLELADGATVKIVELPGSPPKGDAVEFIAARHGRDKKRIKLELERLATDAEPIEAQDLEDGKHLTPVIVRLSDVEPEEVKWLWPGRIAQGKLTILAGDPGLGKSFLSCDFAARISRGSAWPDDPKNRAPIGGVVILNCEDDLADTIQPRLVKHGANLTRIVSLSAVRDASNKNRKRPFDLARDLPALETAIRELGDCRLVIIDPISAYLGADVNSHDNAEVRALLTPLSEMAARHSVAVVAVSHLNKGGGGAAIYRTMGSIAFAATARAVWFVAKDRGNPERRLFLPVKNNVGKDSNGMAFSIVDEKVVWEPDPVKTTADEALSIEPLRRGPEPEHQNAAIAFLRDELSDGPRLVKEVERNAKVGHDISHRTLVRAKQELGVKSFRKESSGPWWWKLPESNGPIPKQPGPLGTLESNKKRTKKKPDQGAKKAKRPGIGSEVRHRRPKSVAKPTK